MRKWGGTLGGSPSARARLGRIILSGVLAASLASTAEGSARADDISGLEGLLSEAIVSSASKQAEGVSATPGLSTSISAEDLRRYGARNLAEAIDFLGIAISSSDDLNGGEVGARGVLLTGDRGSHFLILVDGYVLNDPLRGGSSLGFRAGVPLELIDHIEVIVGPGSVLYGSNAMFGVVNVVTKRAKDYPKALVVAESAPGDDVRAGVGTGLRFNVLGQPGEITTQVEYWKQTGPALFFDAENTGVDRFTGQPGRNSRSGGATGIWGGRRAEHSLYSEGPSGLLRLVVGNTELHLKASTYKYGTPTGPGDFDDPDTGERDTRIDVGLQHRQTISTLLDFSARAYSSNYDTRSTFIASRGVLCPFGQVTCNYVNSAVAD